MQKITKIQTSRNFITHPSWDIVYEWEDELSSKIGLKFKYINRFHFYFNKIIKNFNFFYSRSKPQNLCFVFEMNIDNHFITNNCSGIIPCIIDYYEPDSSLLLLSKKYSRNPFILISSLEIFEYLKNNNFKKKIFHFPLSIPDKYKLLNYDIRDKKYDVVLMGRQNNILSDFFKIYVEKHKGINYVYRINKNDKFLYYSNNGECLGDISTREKYINLMRQAKVGFYSSPGIDDDNARTSGFSQITPRLLEYISCGCHILARYASNSDSDYFEIGKFSPSIQTYEQFEELLDFAVLNEIDKMKYTDYLEKHLTSKRAELLNSIISNI